MWLRRIVAWLLLLAPIQASAASLFADEHGHGGCTDHVCACVKSCPLPKGKKPQAASPPSGRDAASGGASCHGNEAPAGPLMNAAGCGHRKEVVPPALALPHVVPNAAAAGNVETAASLTPPVDAGLFAGFLEIDLPPPRPLS
jgi:hypothetical protein